MQKKEEKRKRKDNITINGKSYDFYKIIWFDIVGDSGISTIEEFDKMQLAEVITYAFIYKQNKDLIFTFSSYSNDGGFGDRNVIPVGVIKDMKKIPSALFVIDVGYENIAITEAKKLGIPVVAVVDTNNSFEEIDYFFPGEEFFWLKNEICKLSLGWGDIF